MASAPVRTVLVLLVALLLGSAVAADGRTGPRRSVTATLGVQTLDTPDYRMLLSRTSVRAGGVRVQLRNGGEDPRNLLLQRADSSGDALAVPLTSPGATATQTFGLAAGTYRLFCTLTAPVVHDAAGMHATLTVVP